MFYPGPFYIGVYGIYDSDFTVLHRQILQSPKMRSPAIAPSVKS